MRIKDIRHLLANREKLLEMNKPGTDRRETIGYIDERERRVNVFETTSRNRLLVRIRDSTTWAWAGGARALFARSFFDRFPLPLSRCTGGRRRPDVSVETKPRGHGRRRGATGPRRQRDGCP